MRLLLLGFLALTCAARGEGSRSFWVWNRTAPLTAAETSALHAAGVTQLWWHAGELRHAPDGWQWKRPFHLPDAPRDIALVPVVRLEWTHAAALTGTNRDALVRLLVDALTPCRAREWQLDCDAPDSQVADYATLLARLKSSAPRLTSTALAGWVNLPAFDELQRHAAALFPMFYDLAPDTLEHPRALLESDELTTWLARWQQRCRVPWLAGLPWFSRVTIYNTSGHSRGHLRAWNWEDLVFRPSLGEPMVLRPGLLRLPVLADLRLAATQPLAGETLLVRQPDPASLARAETQAAQAGAAGVIYFRLPDGSASDGGSLTAWQSLANTNSLPRLSVMWKDDKLTLRNDGTADVTAWDDNATRGHVLELTAPAGSFREAYPGDFVQVRGRGPNDDTTPIPLATRLEISFATLRAGSVLASGLMQLAPAADPRAIQWRVRAVTVSETSSSPWSPLVP